MFRNWNASVLQRLYDYPANLQFLKIMLIESYELKECHQSIDMGRLSIEDILSTSSHNIRPKK